MSQIQCPWCGRCGPRFAGPHPNGEAARAFKPHADGSSCVCRHVTAQTLRGAIAAGGRYWDGSKYVCTVCDHQESPSDPLHP